ncbi:hypothetical protein PT974_01521 [Cladobotryum mycophilum]|uniref:DUF7580 domain-containing protein n=1 Tax=Cladobotryum mycophilum TaxID=491253 RepID=A0ABR0T3Z2_9HYPO
MSGIEVAGLVLGAFPILLNCLEYYKKGFEPLEEWWNFRTKFISFIDDIRHQQMKYQDTLTRLLDPIVTDNKTLTELIDDPRNPRWKDGSLTGPLEQRLSSEQDRFFRIIDRMNEIMQSFNKLLQIEDGQISWAVIPQQKPWQWHYKRLQISFSNGKAKKVKKLEAHNKELEEILGYSERIVPIADRRKSSPPVALLEKVRKHASSVHSTLKKRWKCEGGSHIHEAYLSLRAEVVSVTLSVMFIFSSGGDASSKKKTEEIIIQQNKAQIPTQPMDISLVQRSAALGVTQAELERQQELAKAKPNFLHRSSLILHEIGSSFGLTKKSVRFATSDMSPPTISVTLTRSMEQCSTRQAESLMCSHQSITTTITNDSITLGGLSTSDLISDICVFLHDNESGMGIVEDEFSNHLEFSKSRKGQRMITSEKVELYQLRRILTDGHRHEIELLRRDRFEIAAHIASALLQAYPSPWLPRKWSKNEFYLLVDTETHSVCSTRPFVSQSFVEAHEEEEEEEEEEGKEDEAFDPYQLSEEDTRDCLLNVGVIILELIFGQNIEDCGFYKDYCGKDGKPNDQTDMSAARKWSKKVVRDSGVNIYDVVRRCLDCSFGPKPNFSDVRFRESVYEGVIKPLANYSDVWPEVIQ